MRTHEQVVADVEKRFKELKEEKRLHDIEMAKPKYTKPCETCRHCDKIGRSLYCNNPLVIGLESIVDVGDASNPRWYATAAKKIAVCKGATYWGNNTDMPGRIKELNDEQALWEPRLTRFQKFINLFNKG